MNLAKPPIRKIYSIYKKTTQQPFVIHVHKDQSLTSKTTVLSFINKQDSIRVANVLEQHKRKFGAYPDNDVYVNTVPFKYALKYFKPRYYHAKFSELYINEESYIKQFEWCKTQNINLLLIFNIRKYDYKLHEVSFSIDQLRLLYELNLDKEIS